jgi:hypothetical protein
MTKFHAFFCNLRQIFCSLHYSLIKKYFSVVSSVFDKTRQEKKSKNINRTLLHLETSEIWLECRKSRKNVTYDRLFYPIYVLYKDDTSVLPTNSIIFQLFEDYLFGNNFVSRKELNNLLFIVWTGHVEERASEYI